MKLQSLLVYLAATIALTATTAAQDLLTVLRDDPNTVAFADLLNKHPAMLANLESTKQYTVFAPSNAAVAAFLASTTSNGTVTSRGLSRRSLSNIEASIALLFTDRSNQAVINVGPSDLVTNLTDPAFVNLGPSTPISNSVTLSTSSSQSPSSSAVSTTSTASQTPSLVQSATTSAKSTLSSDTSTLTSAPLASSSTQLTFSSAQPILSPPSSTIQPKPSTSSSPPPAGNSAPADMPSLLSPVDSPPPPGQKRSLTRKSSLQTRQQYQPNITIYSGFGDTAQASKCETTYSSGAVRTVNSFFTLFGDLATTLQKTNGTAFANFLQQAGTLDSLSNTPKITIFVPTDSVLQNQTLDANNLKRYVLLDTLATTTALSTNSSFKSSAGDFINIAAGTDGSFLVNDAYIVGPNVMIKNGVVHFINNVFTHRPEQVVTSAAVVNIPILHTAAIALATVVSYMIMAGF